MASSAHHETTDRYRPSRDRGRPRQDARGLPAAPARQRELVGDPEVGAVAARARARQRVYRRGPQAQGGRGRQGARGGGGGAAEGRRRARRPRRRRRGGGRQANGSDDHATPRRTLLARPPAASPADARGTRARCDRPPSPPPLRGRGRTSGAQAPEDFAGAGGASHRPRDERPGGVCQERPGQPHSCRTIPPAHHASPLHRPRRRPREPAHDPHPPPPRPWRRPPRKRGGRRRQRVDHTRGAARALWRRLHARRVPPGDGPHAPDPYPHVGEWADGVRGSGVCVIAAGRAAGRVCRSEGDAPRR